MDEDKHRALEVLLALASHTAESALKDLVSEIVRFASTAEDRRRAREALLRLMADGNNSRAADVLVAGIVQLAVTTEDKHRAGQALLGLL